MLALSKADLVPDERVARGGRRVAASGSGAEVPVLATSSATGAGVRELAGRAAARVVPASSPPQAERRDGARPACSAERGAGRAHGVPPGAGAGFQRRARSEQGAFAVSGRGIERLLARFDVDNEDAMAYLEGRLRRIGVLGALEAEGFQPGDEIEIAGVTFELDPHESR